MNIPRYKFSKEAEPELIRFLTIVKKNGIKHATKDSSESQDLWKKFLPMDPHIVELLDSIKCDDVVDLCMSDEETTEGAVVPQSDSKSEELKLEHSLAEATISGLNLNVSAVEDISDAIVEMLESNEILTDNLIKQLKSDYTHNELKQIYVIVSQNVSTESLYTLGHSICAAECTEKYALVTPFCDYILLDKLTNEHNDHLEKLLMEFLQNFPQEVNNSLLKKILQPGVNDLQAFQKHLKQFSSEQKQELLRLFLSECSQMESQHLSIISNLLTTQIEVNSVKKLVEMLANVVDDFTMDKTYGKLLLDITTMSGKNIVCIESRIRYILSKHKSVWKAQIETNLDSCIEHNRLLSQSFRI